LSVVTVSCVFLETQLLVLFSCCFFIKPLAQLEFITSKNINLPINKCDTKPQTSLRPGSHLGQFCTFLSDFNLVRDKVSKSKRDQSFLDEQLDETNNF